MLMFIAMGRAFGTGEPVEAAEPELPFNLAILAAVVIAINAVQSLVSIISVYREGGILKPSAPLSLR